jgi:predicted DNA-binding protein
VPRKASTDKQVNFRLPIPVTVRLEAAAAVLGVSQARIIADAVTVYLDALPATKRRVIDDVLAVRKKG